MATPTNPDDSWVPPPPDASLGAGSVVLHDEQVLLVRINYGKFKGSWILPGGRVDPGEHPAAAAVREVREETGLEARVTGQLAVRHRSLPRGLADVYWVFLAVVPGLEPGMPTPTLKWPPEEIIEARFWPIAEALLADAIRPMTRMFIQMAASGEGSISRSRCPPATSWTTRSTAPRLGLEALLPAR